MVLGDGGSSLLIASISSAIRSWRFQGRGDNTKPHFPGQRRDSLHVRKFLLNGTSCEWRHLSTGKITFVIPSMS